MANVITSADVDARMTVTNLYSSGFTLEGFTADNIFDADALDLAETVMGVDGTLSAGAVINTINQTWHIMPDSETYEKFRDWAQQSRTDIAVYRCNCTISFPSSGKKFTLSNGVLRNCNIMPGAGRTMQPIQAVIQWESVTGSDSSS